MLLPFLIFVATSTTTITITTTTTTTTTTTNNTDFYKDNSDTDNLKHCFMLWDSLTRGASLLDFISWYMLMIGKKTKKNNTKQGKKKMARTFKRKKKKKKQNVNEKNGKGFWEKEGKQN